MNITSRQSGLLIASDKAQRPERPQEHPVRQEIRHVLGELSGLLSQYSHTTHGAMGPFTVESVARNLVDCYDRPSSYSISDLAQHIDGFLRAET